jgi:hypothetical protein
VAQSSRVGRFGSLAITGISATGGDGEGVPRSRMTPRTSRPATR